MADLEKIMSFSIFRKITENNEIHSDSMKLLVLLFYETSISSGPT